VNSVDPGGMSVLGSIGGAIEHGFEGAAGELSGMTGGIPLAIAGVNIKDTSISFQAGNAAGAAVLAIGTGGAASEVAVGAGAGAYGSTLVGGITGGVAGAVGSNGIADVTPGQLGGGVVFGTLGSGVSAIAGPLGPGWSAAFGTAGEYGYRGMWAGLNRLTGSDCPSVTVPTSTRPRPIVVR
jgi:hypothetical protein